MALYTDIGMCGESRYLSNIRIAPLQAVMYGHPVSTFGSEIDFFIGGKDTELIELAEYNYSEKLVTVRGIGAIPVQISYKPSVMINAFESKKVAFLGSFYKINSGIIDALETLRLQSKKINPLFIFLLGGGIIKNQSFLFTSQLLKSKLGENTEINYISQYEVYMQKLNSATICLDAYPFGGFNTIVDALHLGKPVVTWEGTKAYNRLASAVLRRLGLCELIATSKEEYVSIATRLLTDKAFYDDICARIASLDIDALLYTREDELEDFVTKIKMIIDGEIKRV